MSPQEEMALGLAIRDALKATFGISYQGEHDKRWRIIARAAVRHGCPQPREGQRAVGGLVLLASVTGLVIAGAHRNEWSGSVIDLVIVLVALAIVGLSIMVTARR